MVRESGESPAWYAPVPEESISPTRGEFEEATILRKTPSAIVERQMFPRQTNITFTGRALVVSIDLVILAVYGAAWEDRGRMQVVL